MAVNGQDKLHLYNGTTWTPIDGASHRHYRSTTSTISNIKHLQNRVFFDPEKHFESWYLPVLPIAGAASA